MHGTECLSGAGLLDFMHQAQMLQRDVMHKNTVSTTQNVPHQPFKLFNHHFVRVSVQGCSAVAHWANRPRES